MTQEKLEREKRSRQFRRVAVPIIKNVLSTTADILGDWVFYSRMLTVDYADDLRIPLLIFSIISSVLGAITAISLVMQHWKVCVDMHNIHKTRFETFINYAMASEMFIEDIPQMVLTTIALARRSGGSLTGPAIFNVTTSAFNFVFNGLDILMPLEEQHYDDLATDFDEEGDTGEVS